MTTTDTPAVALQAATDRLLELAEAAGGGDWTTSTQRYGDTLVIDCHDAVWDHQGTLVAGSLHPGVAAWMATVSPVLAGLLAQVLTEAADNVAKHDPECGDPECVAFVSELALAEAILGGAR